MIAPAFGWSTTCTRRGFHVLTAAAQSAPFRAQGQFPAYRCRSCDGSYTWLTGRSSIRRGKSGHPRAHAAWGRQRRAHGTAGARTGPLAQTTPYAAAAHPSQPERHGADRHDAGRPSRPMSGITTRGKKSTPHLDPAEPPRRRANKRKGHGTSAMIVPPSSASSRVTRGSSAGGCVTMPTGAPAVA